jgi:hypothetical protein
MEQYIPTLVGIIRQAMKNEDTNCKILVFFPASKLVRFFVNLFDVGLEFPCSRYIRECPKAHGTERATHFEPLSTESCSLVMFLQEVRKRARL